MASTFTKQERAALDAILDEALIEQKLAELGRQVDKTILRRNLARKKKAKALEALLRSKKH